MGDNHMPPTVSSWPFQPGSPDSGFSGFNHSTNYDLNSKIMLTAILSLSFVVVLVIVLHIYARCALRRHQARRRAVMNSLGLTNANVNSGEPPKRGLDPTVIASLPIFVYQQTEGQAEDDLIECAVCLSMLEDQEMARILPNCKHKFHAECIDKWLSSHSTCPICRTEAEPMIQPEPREGPAGGTAHTDPMLEPMNSTSVCDEGTSSSVGGNQPSPKVVGSGSRLSSFRRMLSRERSSRRIQPEVQDQEGFQDLERQ
ncbi:PREDICTED: E3 ubiquitin-protein ligase ATL41-like [Populus euphratica]|uniref:RING-type E3 ubiquitin transferase n=1 Tax=Populus euphratica TaxID=75702 RepID=A0AAJ6T1X4_POPEU|nr:PREDICTED: E3 ubiquitin-protein ligase ATL41-like [Populus euphratica]